MQAKLLLLHSIMSYWPKRRRKSSQLHFNSYPCYTQPYRACPSYAAVFAPAESQEVIIAIDQLNRRERASFYTVK